MGSILLPQGRGRPTASARLDTKNTLTRGLVFVGVGSNSPANARQTPYGAGVYQRSYVGNKPVRAGVANSTVFVMEYFAAQPGWNSNSHSYRDTGEGWPGDLGLSVKSALSYGNMAVVARNTGGTGITAEATVSTSGIVADMLFKRSATVDASLLARFYGDDGKLAGSSTALQGYSYNLPAANAAPAFFGASATAGDPDTRTILTLRWNRVLSDAEIALLHADPWAIFASEPAIIRFDTAVFSPPQAMGSILLPATQHRQPTGRQSLSQRFNTVNAYVPGVGFFGAGARTVVESTQVGPEGRQLSSVVTTGTTSVDVSSIDNRSAVTFVAVVTRTGSGMVARVAGGSYGWRFYVDNWDPLQAKVGFVSNWGGGAGSIIVSWPYGETRTIVATAEMSAANTVVNIYTGGAVYGPISSGVIDPNRANAQGYIEYRGDHSQPSMAAVLRGADSVVARSLADNPWQLFAPQQQRIWFETVPPIQVDPGDPQVRYLTLDASGVAIYKVPGESDRRLYIASDGRLWAKLTPDIGDRPLTLENGILRA